MHCSTITGSPWQRDLGKTLQAAEQSMIALNTVLEDVRPGMQRLGTKTLPEVDQLVEDMQALTKSLTSVTERLDQGGAGALISAPALPDYEPGN